MDGHDQKNRASLDKNGLRDLIVQDELLPGKKGDVRKFVEQNPSSLVYKQFFNIQQYESNKKKFIFFMTDGVSVSVVWNIKMQR